MVYKKIFKNKKAIVGVEAAIVLIAFLIIAAALSYVVINMGFYTTQKTKETMQTGLDESLTALQLDGVVIGKTDESKNEILYFLIPVKLSSGKGSVDLGNSSVVVSVYLPNATLLNIYKGAKVTEDTSWDSLLKTLKMENVNNTAKFAIYNDNGFNNTVLESNEKAFLVIRLNSSDSKCMLSEYETVKIEVRAARGASLTVVRTAPGGLNKNAFVDLG